MSAPNFVRACADTEAHAAVIGMISSIPSVNNYYVTQEGFVSGLTTVPVEGGNYIPDTVYYLSTDPLHPGELTAIKPTGVGTVELPCFIAYTATSGFFFGNVGTLIESGSLFQWETVINNTAMTVNKGYFIDGAIALTMTLPVTSAVGDILEIKTLSDQGCIVQCGAGSTITLVDAITSAGGTVTLLTTNGVLQGALRMVCSVSTTPGPSHWEILSGNGNWALA